MTTRVILIGGSSHVGKSTVAQSLAKRLGWECLSTDRLARHPGRPWQPSPKEVPERVARHYLLLSPEELIEDVLRHYRDNVWPLVKELVVSRARDSSTERLVLEGSALLPELVAALTVDHVAAAWLTAGNVVFEQRIHSGSDYENKTAREKEMIDKFLARTQLYNDRMMATVERLGLLSVDVEKAASVEELVERIGCVFMGGEERHVRTADDTG